MVIHQTVIVAGYASCWTGLYTPIATVIAFAAAENGNKIQMSMIEISRLYDGASTTWQYELSSAHPSPINEKKVMVVIQHCTLGERPDRSKPKAIAMTPPVIEKKRNRVE
jgi:hypothetical protein